MKQRRWSLRVSLLAVVTAIVVTMGTAWAQKPKQKKGSATKEAASEPAVVPGGDTAQVLDYQIAEMLAGWQTGDLEMLHKHYADDVSVVSGAYEPPIVGWANFVSSYQRLRQRIQSGQIERRNTYTVVRGNFAWASYQWEFNGIVDGNITRWRGHTTLLFEQRGGQWMIVHNHTSVVPELTATQPAAPPKP